MNILKAMYSLVAVKGLTSEQQSQYNAITSPNKAVPRPPWFEAMPEWEQDFSNKIKGDSKKFDKMIEAEIATQGAKSLLSKKVTFKEVAEEISQKPPQFITRQQRKAARDIGGSIPSNVKDTNSHGKPSVALNKSNISSPKNRKSSNHLD